MFFFTSCSCFWIFGILECIFLLFLLFSFENFESVFGIRIYAVWGGVKGVKHLSLSIGSVDWLLELSKVNRKI